MAVSKVANPSPANLPPGPEEHPVRQAIKWWRAPDTLMEEGRRTHGDVFTIRLPAETSFVFISDPGLVEQVFTADPAVVQAGAANRRIGVPLLGEQSVITLDGDPHLTKRKLLLPPFHGEHMHRYHGVMARYCEEEVASWPLNKPLEMLPRMQSISLKVIMTAIFGVSGGEAQERLANRVNTMLAWGDNRLNMARLHIKTSKGPGGSLPRSFLARRGPLDSVVREEIERARRDPRLEERDDILALLLNARHDDGSPMSDGELRDQMITLLVQGHRSTATAMSWALERLVRHPQAYERLRAEVQSGTEEYLDAVVKETLRVRPPLPYVPRRVAQPYVLDGYEFEVGTMLAPCSYLIHHREDLYPKPYQFRPERWLDQQPGTYTWIPFGGGARHCIGRSFAISEIKEVLRILVRKARLEPAKQADERMRRRQILLTPSDNARVIVKERGS
jgi:cytochrome P450